jgi:PPOX class probable F420-dependent enzyme
VEVEMAELSERERGVLQKVAFVHLCTLDAGGSPHGSVVWVDVDGDTILINTAEGRAKVNNVRNDPRVSVSAADPDNPYDSVSVSGTVEEITHDGADAHIDAMAMKYMGKETYPFRAPDEVRVLLKIRPTSVKSMFMSDFM